MNPTIRYFDIFHWYTLIKQSFKNYLLHVVNCSYKIAYKQHNSLTKIPVLEHNRWILRSLQHSKMGKSKSIIGWSLHLSVVLILNNQHSVPKMGMAMRMKWINGWLKILYSDTAYKQIMNINYTILRCTCVHVMNMHILKTLNELSLMWDYLVVVIMSF